MALFLAALDERVAAAVVSGYFSSWVEAHKMPWNMCGSQVLPGMLGQLEHVDLGALVSPRPLLIESGTGDDLFPSTVAAAEVDGCGPSTPPTVPPNGSARRVRGHPRMARCRGVRFLEHWIGPGDAVESR